MAFGDLDLTTSKARFNALSAHEQDLQWAAFIDDLDAGGVGHHPHYLHLAALYERNETPFDLQRQAQMEPRQLLQGELAFDIYSEEFGSPPF